MSMTVIRMANPSVSLPIDGRVLGMTACASVDSRVYPGATAIDGKTAGRERVASLVKGIATPTVDAFPGTPAWRPPIC